MPRSVTSLVSFIKGKAPLFKHTHELKHLRQILERGRLERHVDQASSGEIYRFVGILAVTDIASPDINHLDDSGEDWGFQEGIGWHANGNDGTAGTSVLDSLLERLLGDGKQDDSVSAQTVGGGGFDIGDNIL